jgi:hypothetical protein
VARINRDSSEQPVSRADWLGREHARRTRPWALEEQLLDRCLAAANGAGTIRDLAERLAEERIALARLEADLQERRRCVLELEHELEAIARRNGHEPAAAPPAGAWAEELPRTVLVAHAGGSGADRDYWLSRCESFRVEAPTGRDVGTVEGVRFVVHIDRPDLLEVGVGRLRHRVLLVSVDDVEYISGEEERVVLGYDPLARASS